MGDCILGQWNYLGKGRVNVSSIWWQITRENCPLGFICLPSWVIPYSINLYWTPLGFLVPAQPAWLEEDSPRFYSGLFPRQKGGSESFWRHIPISQFLTPLLKGIVFWMTEGNFLAYDSDPQLSISSSNFTHGLWTHISKAYWILPLVVPCICPPI